jgi:hypothetical protein
VPEPQKSALMQALGIKKPAGSKAIKKGCCACQGSPASSSGCMGRQ